MDFKHECGHGAAAALVAWDVTPLPASPYASPYGGRRGSPARRAASADPAGLLSGGGAGSNGAGGLPWSLGAPPTAVAGGPAVAPPLPTPLAKSGLPCTVLTLQYVGLPAQTTPTLCLRSAPPVFRFEQQREHLAVPCYEGALQVRLRVARPPSRVFCPHPSAPSPRGQDGAVFAVAFDRTPGKPLGLKVYKDGLFFERLSSCCECVCYVCACGGGGLARAV